VSPYDDGSDICVNTGGSLFQRGGTAMAVERFANFNNNDVTGGRRSVRTEEERVERDG
jgi:hypothetical protein